jgi:pimeloyl-ACP methyl ester carboxylesterase
MKILLIHGLSRTPLSLLSLERRLYRAGWDTEQFAYVALLESYDAIVARLRDRLQQLQQPYAIVAHSLGGLLLRSALTQAPAPEQVIMLGTPNRQPRLAAIANRVLLFQWWTGQCGANLDDQSFFATLPALSAPYTIIAGTGGPRGAWSPFGTEINDGIVALSETYLTERDRVLTFPVLHSFMMQHKALQTAILDTLSR